MAAPSFAAEAAKAPTYPVLAFGPRERKLLQSVADYLNAGLSAAQLASGSVTLSKLATGIAPSHVAKFAGTFSTLGGDASESISIPGALASDIVMVSVKTAGASPRSIVAATAASNAITVTLSGDPSTDHVLQYVVMRAAA